MRIKPYSDKDETKKLKLLRRMKRARKIAGLTQQALADEIGLSRAMLNKIESGLQRLSMINALNYVDTLAAHGVPERWIPALDDLARLP